jgi:hypothetical protein
MVSSVVWKCSEDSRVRSEREVTEPRAAASWGGRECNATDEGVKVISVREIEKASRNRRLKENVQLQSQMIVHGVKGTFGDAVGVQWMVGAR